MRSHIFCGVWHFLASVETPRIVDVSFPAFSKATSKATLTSTFVTDYFPFRFSNNDDYEIHDESEIGESI